MSLEVLLAVSLNRTMATCKCLLMEGASVYLLEVLLVEV